MDDQTMREKIALVTGANSGIGARTALALARRGATVLLACRDLAKARRAADEIASESGNDAVSVVALDLADLRSVERCAAEVTETVSGVDVLVNNAGAAFRTRKLSAQGVELSFAVNHLGHYALTRLLLPRLRRGSARVISVSSMAHRFVSGIRWDDLDFANKYTLMSAYGHAKLAQILFTRELAQRDGASGIFAHSVHPGWVGSNFHRTSDQPSPLVDRMTRLFAKTPDRGAQTSVHLATSADAERGNGGFWVNRKPARASRAATDATAARRLWQRSEELVTESGIDLPAIVD